MLAPLKDNMNYLHRAASLTLLRPLSLPAIQPARETSGEPYETYPAGPCAAVFPRKIARAGSAENAAHPGVRTVSLRYPRHSPASQPPVSRPAQDLQCSAAERGQPQGKATSMRFTSARRRFSFLGSHYGKALVAGLGVAGLIAAAASTAPAAASQLHASAAAKPAAASANRLSRIRHVWIIELENTSFQTAFNHPKSDPELARVLPSRGALLRNYYGIGHDSLDNYIAEVSGQAPDFQTGQDCEYFSRFLQFGGETFDKWTKYGQLSGDGCVYPKYVGNIGTQLTARHLSWKSYNQQMGVDPARDGTTKTADGPACGHPKLGAIDETDVTGPANDSYATRHNPFVYFESVIRNKAYCDAHVVSLTPLARDLKSVATTPNYSWITPDTCSDAHDTPRCQNGAKGGLVQADKFLATWVPRIMRSPAYRQNGLIVVTFDESGNDENAAACCGEKDSLGYDDPSHPNTNEPGLFGPGGGRVGAVLLSPFIKPGTVSTVPYNHYSLLKTVERIFGVKLNGDAKQPQVHAFGADVFTRA
jgi:phosphatidylinositol-3-phosphatase